MSGEGREGKGRRRGKDIPREESARVLKSQGNVHARAIVSVK